VSLELRAPRGWRRARVVGRITDRSDVSTNFATLTQVGSEWLRQPHDSGASLSQITLWPLGQPLLSHLETCLARIVRRIFGSVVSSRY
jgi:hypothetical protein